MVGLGMQNKPAQGGALPYIAESLRPLAVSIDTLTPDPSNARTHDDRNIAAIKASLERFGQRLPIVVQRQGMVVRAGNGRLTAAKLLGWTHMAAVVVDESDVEAVSFAIADNRTAELAAWDDGALASLLQSLPAEARIGFDDADLTKLLDGLRGEVEEDDAPEPLAEAVSRRGDVWTLGNHRLMCGDSTDGGDVALCLSGAKPFLMVTDPPYGVEYEGGEVNDKKREKLSGDENPDLYSSAFKHCPSDVAYTWFSGTKAMFVYTYAIQNGFNPRALLIWNKLKAHYAAPSAHYKQKHEPLLYSVRNGKSAKWAGDMTVSTVLDIDQPSINEHHPTQKPVECMARPIRNHEAPEVYDPFSGSGTTIVACEQLGRRCFAIEIEPKYVDVAIRRWQKLTGKAATLDGKTWADVAAERGVAVDNG